MTAAVPRVRVGVNPIAWTNDDFPELGDDIPVERCLAEAREAGYEGIELGRKLPREAGALRRLLDAHGLALASGWHSFHLLERPPGEERHRLERHLDLLDALGCRVAVVAECSGRTYPDRGAPLRFGDRARRLPDAAMDWLARALDGMAEAAAARGMELAYHPHAGTCIQDGRDVDRLLERTAALGFLFDSGHLALAGSDPQRSLQRWSRRVRHVHFKNVREDVARRVREEGWTFERGVKAGMFTVPGDPAGGLDFEPFAATLTAAAYAGWVVVEAEQDPAVAPPLETVRRGRAWVRRAMGA